MISQRCPKCRSNRIRRGYKKTPVFMKLLFRYHLLCDNCNWEFSGFAVPGTVSAKPKRGKKKTENTNILSKNPNNKLESNPPDEKVLNKGERKKKKVRIKFN